MELMQASHQWASRPQDQRFTSLTAMLDKMEIQRGNSTGKVISSRRIEVQPAGNDHKSLVVVGPNGHGYAPTHWAFGQLCQRAESPASYLRELPSEIAADAINFKLRFARGVEDIGVLLERSNIDDGMRGADSLRAVTGPNYGRIWNEDICRTLVKRFGDGVTGDWRVPGEFGKAVTVDKNNTTLYAGDRDMFVFLADEINRIEIPRRGGTGTMARGFFISNSEVGKAKFNLSTFYFDYACCNRIVWGAEGFQSIELRHTSSAPDRWLEELQPALQAYHDKSTAGIKQLVIAAQASRLDKVDEFLATRFGVRKVAPIKAVHELEEGRPIETLWDASTAVTAYAKSLDWQDARVELETAAGAILDLAAA